MSTSFQFTEALEETSLAEMFYTIYRHRVPGLLEISRGEVVKRIHIGDGHVIHASSNTKKDWLGPYLYRTGQMSRELLEETMTERTHSPKRHGEILLERCLLSPAELADAIRGQMESIVWSVFGWTEGQVTFRIGDFADASQLRIHIPLRQVILRGISKAPDTKTLVSKLGNKKTIFRPSYQVDDLIRIALDAQEYQLLRLVDGQRTLFEICSEGPYGLSENARRLYAFRVLQLIERIESRRSQDAGVMIRLPDRQS